MPEPILSLGARRIRNIQCPEDVFYFQFHAGSLAGDPAEIIKFLPCIDNAASQNFTFFLKFKV